MKNLLINSKNRLKKEIEATKESIKKLQQIKEDSISGIEINDIVQKAFEDALKNLS